MTHPTCPNSDAVVNGSSLQTFNKNLTADDRNLLQISQSYAQSFPVYHYGKQEAVVWFNYSYLFAFQQLGWELSGATSESKGITFDRYVCKGKKLQLDKTVMELITDKKLGASKHEIEYVRMSMSSLQKFEDSSEQMSIWDSHARNKHESGKLANFQILPCEKDSEGTLTILVLAFVYTAQKSKGRFLWYNWKKGDITVQQAAARLQLKEYGSPRGYISKGTQFYSGRVWLEAQLPNVLEELTQGGINLIRNLPLG